MLRGVGARDGSEWNLLPSGTQWKTREEVEDTWWSQFPIQVLPTHLPLSKWKDKIPNREIGDIVLVAYPGLKEAEFRMGDMQARALQGGCCQDLPGEAQTKEQEN